MGGELIQLGEFQGVAFAFRPGDDMIPTKPIAQVTGKRWANYWRTKRAKAHADGVAAVTQIRATELTTTVQGGEPNFQGTWAHSLVALDFARDASPPLGVWMMCQILRLIRTGKVVLHREHVEATLTETIGSPGTEQFMRRSADLTADRVNEKIGPKLDCLLESAKKGEETGKKLEAGQQYLISRIDSQRDAFDRWVRVALAQIIAEHFSQKCPITGDIITSRDGKALKNFELHHWGGRAGKDSKWAFGVSERGHLQIENNRTREVVFRSAYDEQQRYLQPLRERHQKEKKLKYRGLPRKGIGPQQYSILPGQATLNLK